MGADAISAGLAVWTDIASAATKQSTVFQVRANLKGVLALIIALRVTMSFRMTATMMSLWVCRWL